MVSGQVMSDRECELYECYYEAHGESRYCVHHQPIRLKTGATND
jgi:hypothetical protein